MEIIIVTTSSKKIQQLIVAWVWEVELCRKMVAVTILTWWTGNDQNEIIHFQ